MGKLEGKVALVTGSGRNIGRATVLKLAAEGAHVVVNARTNQAEADAVVREAKGLGVKALAVVADVASKDQVEAMAARALSEFGRVDILINNAAIRPHKPFTELTAAGLGSGPGRGARRRGVPHARAHRADGEERIWAHPVLHRRRRLRRRQRTRACLGGQDGPGRLRARAGLGVRAAEHPGQRGLAGQHRYHGATIPNGIRGGRRTPPAFPWGVRGTWTRSPPPACSWSVTMAASSPARRSTSTAGAGITDPQIERPRRSQWTRWSKTRACRRISTRNPWCRLRPPCSR